MTIGKKNILVIDDSPINRQLLKMSLDKDYHILIAAGGIQGLELAETVDDIALILLDVMMPDLDGYAVIKKLKAADQLKHIPVIFLTAKDAEEDEALGLRLGAVDYINKPIDVELLKLRVSQLIDKQV